MAYAKIWDNMLEAIECMEGDAQKGAFLLKLIRYSLRGEEPDIEQHERMLWVAFQNIVDKEVEDRENGRKGGRPKSGNPREKGSKNPPLKPPFKPPFKTPSETPHENPLENQREEEVEEEVEEEYELPRAGAGGDSGEIFDFDHGFAKFLVASLNAYNEATGSDVRDMPFNARMGLRAAYDNGRTIEDVRTVIRKTVGKWEPKMVTPNALFGDKFEQWLNAYEEPEAAPKPKYPSIADCPICGDMCYPITPGSPVFRCDKCDKQWSAA